MGTKRLFAIAALLFAASLLHAQQIVALDGYVVRVSKHNQLSEVLSLKTTGPDLRYGTTDPIVSPDQKHIALIRDDNAWVRDVKSGHEHRVTTAGKPGTESLLPIAVYLVGFSTDGKQLYYSIARGRNECPDCPHRNPKPQQADYGLFGYTLKSKMSEKVPAPGNIRLVSVLTGNRISGTLVGDYGDQNGIFALPDFHFTPYPKACASAFHCSVSKDGKRPVCLQISAGQPQVIRCDGANVKDLSRKAACGNEFSNEQPSTSGRHTAYVHAPGCKGDTRSLVVDEKPVFQCKGLSNFKWLDDDRLLVHCSGELKLIDVSGKQLGSMKVAEPAPRSDD